MSWHDKAVCKGQFHLFHDDSVKHKFIDDGVLAKLLCAECPVRGQCLDEALMHKERQGEPSSIWGGFKPHERTKISKKIAVGAGPFNESIRFSVSNVASDIVNGI